MIDLAKRGDALHALNNPAKYPPTSPTWKWMVGYVTEALGLLQPTAPTPVPPVVNLTPQQAFDKIIAEAPEGTVLNLGNGAFSVTISKT